MRRQNPPQAYFDKALEFENYLKPITIATIYVIVGILYCALVSLVFAALVNASVLKPSPAAITIFAVIGFVPAAFLFLAPFLRPYDPLSRYISDLAETCRKPIPLTPDDCNFKVQLMDGEILQIKLAFKYPEKFHTQDVREKMYTVVYGALTKDFCTRVISPGNNEIEETIDVPLGFLAAEYNIPVLYAQVLDVSQSREKLDEEDYLNTGTYAR